MNKVELVHLRVQSRTPKAPNYIRSFCSYVGNAEVCAVCKRARDFASAGCSGCTAYLSQNLPNNDDVLEALKGDHPKHAVMDAGFSPVADIRGQ